MRSLLLAVHLWSAPPVPEWSVLGNRAVSFMADRPGGEYRVRRPEDRRFYRRLAFWAWTYTRGARVSPEVVLAVAFRESSWKPWVVGRAGEVGIMQLHGRRARMGYDPEALLTDPGLNVYCGVAHLERSIEQCRGVRAGLVQYGSGSCRPRGRARRRAEYAADLVLRWARRMR